MSATLQKEKMELPLSESLCEFIGAIIGDGCIDGHRTKTGRSKYNIFITGNSDLDRDYLLKRISLIIEELFQKKPKVRYRLPRTLILSIYSKKIFMILTERFGFVPGNKTYTASIPKEIMVSEDRYIFATIRGLIDTDGCVYLDRRSIYRSPYPRIVFTTVSRGLFLQIKGFLSKHFSIYAAEKRNLDGPFYEIVVYGQKQVSKWIKCIGFSNERHLRKLYLLREAPNEI